MHRLIQPASKPRAEYHEWDPRYPGVVRSFLSAMDPLPSFLGFEHVGSTAIPGAGGKRVIDLLALYEDGCLEKATAFLLGIGFGRQGPEFVRAWPDKRPMFLGLYHWSKEPFLVYVHVVQKTSDEARRFQLFKERLKGDPGLLNEYCRCKKKIVSDGVTDTDEYAALKRPFFHKVLGNEYTPKNTGA